MNSTSSDFRQPYEPVKAAERFSDRPRFGHSSNFVSLFEGEDQAKDYIAGLVFVGALMASFFLLWSLFLVVFKCMGRDRVGFLSGAQFRQQVVLDKSTDPDKPTSEPKCNTRPMRLRITFLTSGIIFVLFTILLVTQGLSNLQSTADTVEYSAIQVQQLSEDAASILDSGLRDLGDIAISLRSVLQDELQRNNLCPADPLVQNSDIAQQVAAQGDTAIELLDALADFSINDINTIEKAVDRVNKGATTAAEEAGGINLDDWRAILALIPYFLFPAILMAACLLSLFDITMPWVSCIIAYLITPIFILMVLFAWITASAIVIAAGANGDFCLPGGQPEQNTPDTTVLRILDVYGYSEAENPLVYQIVSWYIYQCVSADEDPFAFLRVYLEQIETGQGGVNQLEAAVNTEGVIEELSLYCNRDFAPLVQVLDNMKEVLNVLGEAAVRSLDLVSCERIVPIYTSTIYDGTCDYSVNAMAWCFSATLIIGFFGMVMLTIRSAYKPTVYEDQDGAILEPQETKEDEDYPGDEYSDRSGEQRAVEVDDSNSTEDDENNGVEVEYSKPVSSLSTPTSHSQKTEPTTNLSRY